MQACFFNFCTFTFNPQYAYNAIFPLLVPMLCATIAITLFLLLCSANGTSVTISVTQFDDNNLYFQFYPFTAGIQEFLPLKCLNQHFNLPINEHLSEYRGQQMLRAKLGPIGVKTEEKVACLLFLATKEATQIFEIPVRKLLGTPHQSELPKEISFPPVKEIVEGDSLDYDFTDEPLAVIESYENIYDEYDFGFLDPRLTQANLQLKSTSGAKIYLSLTTSPSRLKLLHYTLRSMNLELVDEIFVTLPKLFKGTQKYTIPRALLQEFPQLNLLSEERDFGPICKLTSAVQFVYSRDSKEEADKAIFITIDDDNLYSDRLIDTLAYHSLINAHSVITAAALEFFPFVSFGIHRPQEISFSGDHLKRVADVEGFAGVAYRGGQVDWRLMKFLADKQQSPEHRFCYFSDDVVISNVLLLRNVPILRLPLEKGVNFYSRNERRDLPHFRDANSLQLTNEDGQRDKVYMHIRRYQYCQMELLSYFINFNTTNLPFKEL